MQLDEELKEKLIELIQKGKPIPFEYKNLLFPPDEVQGEYELVYKGKKKKEDILADTMSVPFQAVKKFGNVKEGEWHNKLIFGDNLQALKHLMNDSEVKGKVRLIYIDPPFGTGDIYDAKGAPAYSAALRGAEFIESLRERLVFLREILADDGSIYLRIDYHFGHYVKAIMDEIFGKNNFRNEIVVNRVKKSDIRANRFNTATDSLFFYTKSNNYIFNNVTKKLEVKKTERWHALDSQGSGPSRIFFGKELSPPPSRHWTFTQENIEKLIALGGLRLKCRNCGYIHTGGKWKKCRKCGADEPKPEYKLKPTGYQLLDSNWTDIPGYTFKWNYPTENSEQLLERVINASSKLNDIVLDAYIGSGTTGAVAEKLGRRWIMIDSSKLAIYTIIKRMFNLKTEIGNKGRQLKPQPFVLYNAGLYEDHGFILKMGEDNYESFALELFQCEQKKLDINGLKMNGMLFNCPVKVFSRKGYLTEEYIDELHNTVGDYIKARMFIIAPASRVYFLQDYIEKNGIRYYILRIPYSVIDELHNRQFTRPMQPSSQNEINQNIEQRGFDFIHPPEIKAKYYLKQPSGQLFDEMVIEIESFEAVQRSKEPVKFKDPKEALSMVLVDTNYNSKNFNMIHRFFADEIKKEGYRVRVHETKPGKKIMIIYIDIFGNERIEVKPISDFRKKK